MKKRTVFASIMTIVLCLCLISGSTFALFTSEEETNIAVTAGTVNVEAKLLENSLKTWSLGETVEEARADGTFANKGSLATVADGDLTLTNIVPGDNAQVTIDVENKSNVSVAYRVTMSVVGELADALTATATVNGTALEFIDGATLWTYVEEPLTVIDDIVVTVTFPDSDEVNDYQGKEATVILTVEAIQGNAMPTNYYDISAQNLASVDFTQSNVAFRLNGEFADGIAISELGENSTVTFHDVTASSIVLPDGATVTGENKITGTGITGSGDLNFADGTLEITEGANITTSASEAVVTITNMSITSNAGLKASNDDKTTAQIIIKDSIVRLEGELNTSASNGSSTLIIENSEFYGTTIFVGGHTNNARESVAVFNVKESYIYCAEAGLGSTISVWGQEGVESTIVDSEIHTDSRGWHQSEDANDNSITFQGGTYFDITIERTNIHTYGARSIINARNYGSGTPEVDFKINESFIWIITKSSHGEETLPVWGGAEITDSVIVFTKNVGTDPVGLKTFIYGNPVIHGDFDIANRCSWATDIALSGETTLTLAKDAVVSIYDGAAEVNFVLSENASVVIEEGASLTNLGIVAADGYTLNTETADGSTVYTVTPNE